jgi:hypothetical protein
MPSKDFKIRVRNKDGKEFDARTSIVNFDSEDLDVAKAEWEKQHIGTGQTLVSIELIGDTTEQGMRAIQETVDKVNSVTARNAPPAPSAPASTRRRDRLRRHAHRRPARAGDHRVRRVRPRGVGGAAAIGERARRPRR